MVADCHICSIWSQWLPQTTSKIKLLLNILIVISEIGSNMFNLDCVCVCFHSKQCNVLFLKFIHKFQNMYEKYTAT